MILVTVGTQLPFDRLVSAMDELAVSLPCPVVAQIGRGGRHIPQHMEAHDSLLPDAFDQLFASARAVVSHAGTGTILLAQRLAKPLIIMPRRVELREHRNDHQWATAKQMAHYPGIFMVQDRKELEAALTQAIDTPFVAAPPLQIGRLKSAVSRFLGAPL